jgi:hypothetical protein
MSNSLIRLMMKRVRQHIVSVDAVELAHRVVDSDAKNCFEDRCGYYDSEPKRCFGTQGAAYLRGSEYPATRRS